MNHASLYKATALVILIFFLISGLIYAKTFLIPVAFAMLLSMLLLPLTKGLEKKGVGRVPAILLSILLVIVIIAAIVMIFYSQVASLANDIELIREKLLEKLNSLQIYIESRTGVSAKEQMEWLKERYSAFMNSSASFLKNLLMGFTSAFVAVGLIVIYIFFFLLYRERFKKFILKLFAEEHHIKVEGVINNVKGLILHYLTGLLIALTILGVMNSIGLLALGIRQAVFLGLLAGYLNVIPYVGTLVGSLFPIIMALLFKDSIWYAFGVAAIFLFNQFIDNNITTPKVVGSHVQVNPLATIMAVISGGLIWGIAGMILFIPLLGIFKIICDNVEPLKPIGYLLGEDQRKEDKPGFIEKIKGIF
jgi:predicted PurR-regulated permease PerM